MAIHDWGPMFHTIGRKMGKSLEVLETGLVRTAFKEAGFANVEVKHYKVPLTGWPQDEKLRQIGMFNHVAIDQGIEGYSMYMLTQVMGWSPSRCRSSLRVSARSSS
jgi:hypothetical protein